MSVNEYVVFGSAWMVSTATGLVLYRRLCKEKRELSYDVGASIIGAGSGVFGGILLAAAFRLNESLVSLAVVAIACGIACSVGFQRSFESWIDRGD